MKFDAARAIAIFEKLGDPAFAGPDGERRIADFVADELQRMGWIVARREVEGSRFPQLVGPWMMWIGYGVLITAGFCVILGRNPRAANPGCAHAVFPGLQMGAGTRVQLGAAWAADCVPWRKLPSSSPPAGAIHRLRCGLSSRQFLAESIPAFWGCSACDDFGSDHAPLLPLVFCDPSLLFNGHSERITGHDRDHLGDHRRCLGHDSVRPLLGVSSLAKGDGALRTDRLSTALLLEVARTWPRRRSDGDRADFHRRWRTETRLRGIPRSRSACSNRSGPISRRFFC